MFTRDEIAKAHEAVLQTLGPTPAIAWPLLSARLGALTLLAAFAAAPAFADDTPSGVASDVGAVQKDNSALSKDNTDLAKDRAKKAQDKASGRR